MESISENELKRIEELTKMFTQQETKNIDG